MDNASRQEPQMSRTFSYTASVRDTVRRRAGGKCERCGEEFRKLSTGLLDGTLHHRHKREFGGADTVTNLLYIHAGCHRALHRDEEWAAQFGLILWKDESTWKPVTVRTDGRLAWVILTADGDYDVIAGQLAGELLGDCSRPGHQPKARPERQTKRRAA